MMKPPVYNASPSSCSIERRTSAMKYGALGPSRSVLWPVMRRAVSAAANSAGVTTPSASISSSTTLRRRTQERGLLRGFRMYGLEIMPASSAASGSVSSLAPLPKYSRAAASMPQAPLPK